MSGQRAVSWNLWPKRDRNVIPHMAHYEGKLSRCGMSQLCGKIQQVSGSFIAEAPEVSHRDRDRVQRAIELYIATNLVKLCREFGITQRDFSTLGLRAHSRAFKGLLFICSGGTNARSLRSKTWIRSRLNASGRISVLGALTFNIITRVP